MIKFVWLKFTIHWHTPETLLYRNAGGAAYQSDLLLTGGLLAYSSILKMEAVRFSVDELLPDYTSSHSRIVLFKTS
jgi:hypothetical protein